jgi:hypothetical protein
MIKKNQKDWDEQQPFAMMAYRTAVHSTTGETPFSMMFGREILLPIDVLYGDPNLDQADRSVLITKDSMGSRSNQETSCGCTTHGSRKD